MNASSHGLGLNICHKIIKALGGQITVESQQGEGSSFTFCFDAKRVKNVSLNFVTFFRSRKEKFGRINHKVKAKNKCLANA